MSPLARRTSARPVGSGGGRGAVGHNVGTFLQRARSGRGCSARASARDRAVAAQGGLASLCRLLGIIAALSTPAVSTRSTWASVSVSESDDDTRLSFPSTDPGREVCQPSAVVGLCHGRASLCARRLRSPSPAGRWSSCTPPPCYPGRSSPCFHVNAALFMTTRIAFMAYLSSLTGMRRRAFAPSEWLGRGMPGLQGLGTGIRVWRGKPRWRRLAG
jgi:hypothetical protein